MAKRLGIDCAPAMVGWDYHCGGSHPVFEGYVVCEEFEDTLMDAWEAVRRDSDSDFDGFGKLMPLRTVL